MPEDVADLCTEVAEEVARAVSLHPPMTNHHEAYAVILEELDEYWEHVRMKACERDAGAMRTELRQTAAMCVRAIHDLLRCPI